MQNIVFYEDDSKLNKPDKIRLVFGFSPDFSRLKTKTQVFTETFKTTGTIMCPP
jgi:hypothetical protein